MKTKISIIVLTCWLAILAPYFTNAQNTISTDTFKVYGNCDMCKSKIEGALKKKDGIISKRWDVKAKTITVSFDTNKINVKEIGQKIADVGYDNEYANAKDEVYNKLHTCCQYERHKK